MKSVICFPLMIILCANMCIFANAGKKNIKLSRELFLSASGQSQTSEIRLRGQMGIAHFGIMRGETFLVGPSTFVKKINKDAKQPESYTFSQNYPNPFNSSTMFLYDLPKRSHVDISLYSVLGKKLVTLVSGVQETGRYQISFDGMNRLGEPLSSGVYFCQIIAGEYSELKKIVIVR